MERWTSQGDTAERVDRWLRERPDRPELHPIRYQMDDPFEQINWRAWGVVMLLLLILGATTVHVILPGVLRAAVALWGRL